MKICNPPSDAEFYVEPNDQIKRGFSITYLELWPSSIRAQFWGLRNLSVPSNSSQMYFRKSNLSVFVGSSLIRRLFVIIPAILNSLSDVDELAGGQRYVFAKELKIGNCFSKT